MTINFLKLDLTKFLNFTCISSIRQLENVKANVRVEKYFSPVQINRVSDAGLEASTLLAHTFPKDNGDVTAICRPSANSVCPPLWGNKYCYLDDN